jgi:hypothetical protein
LNYSLISKNYGTIFKNKSDSLIRESQNLGE